MHDYYRLLVWQRAQALATTVYETTSAFPRAEVFGLTAQMRRSAVSVAANLAEGAGRDTRADFRRFVRMASGSACELETQVRIALSIPHLGRHVPADLHGEVEQVKRLLYRFERSLDPPAVR